MTSSQEFETHLQIPNAVCVTLDAERVIEAADNGLSREDYLSRSRLILDGAVWERGEPSVVMEFAGAQQELERDPETGETTIVRSNATGPFTLCWETGLGTGSHTSQYKIAKSSGQQLSYEWSFSIGE
jgi:hypothetical protein